MPKKRYNAEDIIHKLREARPCTDRAVACSRQHDPVTQCAWLPNPCSSNSASQQGITQSA
jgi:hypothetical protein